MVRSIYDLDGRRARDRLRAFKPRLRYFLQLIAMFMFAYVLPVRAQIDSSYVDAELATASRFVNEGHVKEGKDRLVVLLGQIDATKDKDKDKDNYWRVGATLVEFLKPTRGSCSSWPIAQFNYCYKDPRYESSLS
jgi:hypothetical protein